MKTTLIATGLSAALATAAIAEDTRTADDCFMDIMFDNLNVASELVIDRDFTGLTNLTLIYTETQRDQMIFGCERETDTEAVLAHGLTRLSNGQATIEFE